MTDAPVTSTSSEAPWLARLPMVPHPHRNLLPSVLASFLAGRTPVIRPA